jgi:hypothetical protein
LKLEEFENLTQAKSLFYTLEVISCVRNSEASTDYIFQRRIHISNISVNFKNHENNINNINSVQLFIKMAVLLLRHLDSFRERHANRLKRWEGCKPFPMFVAHCAQVRREEVQVGM